MSTTRIIRELWLLGNAGLLAALVLPPPAHIIVMGAADVALAVAWVMAIYRACKSRQWLWAFAMAVWPLAVWVYIFVRRDEAPQQSKAPQPPDPRPSCSAWPAAPPPLENRPSNEPLVLREAL